MEVFMTNSEKLFLLLAEELNFSRAAKKAFISQQCLSDHIRRLEEHYGTDLFFRRPNVMLTDAGKAVQRTLLSVLKLEQGLSNELSEIEDGSQGTLRIGMNSSRAQLLLPEVFAQYSERYPRVSIELVLGETEAMQEKMNKGLLDCYLGVNARFDELMVSYMVAYESLYLMVSDNYLRDRLGVEPDRFVNQKSELDFSIFQDQPFAINGGNSTTHQAIQQYFTHSNVSPNVVFLVSDYGILETLCRANRVATFCPQIYVPTILSHNANYTKEEHLCLLPVRELNQVLRLDLINNRALHYPRYMLDFFALLSEYIRGYLTRAESGQSAENTYR